MHIGKGEHSSQREGARSSTSSALLMHAHRTSTDGEFQLIKETARALTSTSETSSTCLRSALTNDGWEGARQRAFGCVNKGTCVDVRRPRQRANASSTCLRPTLTSRRSLACAWPTCQTSLTCQRPALTNQRTSTCPGHVNVPRLVNVRPAYVNKRTHVNVPGTLSTRPTSLTRWDLVKVPDPSRHDALSTEHSMQT